MEAKKNWVVVIQKGATRYLYLNVTEMDAWARFRKSYPSENLLINDAEVIEFDDELVVGEYGILPV